MKKQKEEELGKKGSQVKSEETPCPEHKECENTDKKSCRKEESCQKGEDKECKKLEEKITALENEKKSVEEKLAKEKDDYVRLMSEFETFRRRSVHLFHLLLRRPSRDCFQFSTTVSAQWKS